MTDLARRAKALALLKSTGILRSNYEPPYLRALWRLGVDARPPHFMPFAGAALAAAAWFGIAWGALMWMTTWSRGHMAVAPLLPVSCAAGLLFGIAMASYYAYGRRKHQLPAWETLQGQTPRQ